MTGGAGFIGSAVVDQLLASDWSVLVIDNLSSGRRENLSDAARSANFRLEVVDIRDPTLGEIFASFAPDVVFHLAAQPSVSVSVAKPADDADVNIVGSLRVLDGARSVGAKKIVFAASGGTLYGELDAEMLPVTEAAPHRPRSPYGLAKKTTIDYLVLYRDLFGLDCTALALANIYGPRQDPHGEAGVVAIFAAALSSGLPCEIDGDGNQTRDFVYVDDAARAFVLAADRASGLIVNVGTGTQVSINQLYALLAESAGRNDGPPHGPARAGDVRFSALDSALARDRLAWIPEVPLSEGLQRTLLFFSRGDTSPDHRPRSHKRGEPSVGSTVA